MELLLALVVLAPLVAALVALVRGPGHGGVPPSHPDAERLAAERARIADHRSDERPAPVEWDPAA